ncbi:MAG: hypothetical protein JST83_01615 [Bacteroidetes bacterium]|nr:hypothetical protein [Bacteroidota bacterium]
MSDETQNLNESGAAYDARPKKKITFFSSFEEAEEHGLREMASHSYEQRLENLEVIRRRTYGHRLLPDGSWPPLDRIITIEKRTDK